MNRDARSSSSSSASSSSTSKAKAKPVDLDNARRVVGGVRRLLDVAGEFLRRASVAQQRARAGECIRQGDGCERVTRPGESLCGACFKRTAHDVIETVLTPPADAPARKKA